MERHEFHQVVKPYTHQDDELIFDVRAFGERQAEAIECYLEDRLRGVKTTGLADGGRLMVLLCDASVEISEKTMREMEELAARGLWMEIRHSCAERAALAWA